MLVRTGTTTYTQDLAAPLTQILQARQGSTTTHYLYGLDRLASTSGGTRTWYGADALGSVRQTLNNSGAVLGTVNYNPWGSVESGSVPTFGFTGEIQDSLGMVYLRARWYNAAQGRFGVRDPFAGMMERPQTLAPYPYVENNPVNRIDPSGKLAIFLAGMGASNKDYEDDEVGVWEMAQEFANDIPMRGKVLRAASEDLGTRVIPYILQAKAQCPDEPIILVGHSLGANVAVNLALAVSDNIKIDLLVTIDIMNPQGLIPAALPSAYEILYKISPPNVREHININSDTAANILLHEPFPWSVPFALMAKNVVRDISGANNITIPGPIHVDVDDRNIYMTGVGWRPNPAWATIKNRIEYYMKQ